MKTGETKRRKYWVPWRVVWSDNISREGWVVWQWGIRQHLLTRPLFGYFGNIFITWDVRVCSIYSNTMKWPLRETERGRHLLMTPTTAIYLHQSSNSSGSWVEERMNGVRVGGHWETMLLYFMSTPKVELIILILQSTGREEINIAFVTINSESLQRCGTNIWR